MDATKRTSFLLERVNNNRILSYFPEKNKGTTPCIVPRRSITKSNHRLSGSGIGKMLFDSFLEI